MDVGKEDPLQSRYSTYVRFWRKKGNLELTLNHLFIDFKTTYDSINRKALIAAMVQNDLSDLLEIKNSVRQGDAPTCLLFNLPLEKVVRDSNINTRGNIFNNQLLTFADDIDIIARTLTALRQALRMGLKINENKTKNMPCIKSGLNDSHFKIEEYSFEVIARKFFLTI
ncbi:putative endonuclease-reverse transcriptase [Trichonephila clavipes]|nr:putative endonuclease-reverse transcriptase [Trichonephila clavipes]